MGEQRTRMSIQGGNSLDQSTRLSAEVLSADWNKRRRLRKLNHVEDGGSRNPRSQPLWCLSVTEKMISRLLLSLVVDR